MMVDWDLLINEDALASVMPDEYAQFARPVKDALTVFLEGLPEERQGDILAEQAALPPTASISKRLGLMARSCPVLHKLGQILARDQRLALELRQQLQELESLLPSISTETIQNILAREFGPLDRLGVTLETPAIAEASVAVVVGFQQQSGDVFQNGVFKILKPGIEQLLEEELELFENVGEYLDQRCDELQIPHLDYRETFEQVRNKLLLEIRLDQEQLHLTEAYAFYADEPRVQIPRLFDFCTSRVTAMQRVTGGKVTDHCPGSSSERRRLSELVVEALITQPIFSRDSQAMFHCDPHAGNLFFTREGRLAILDWSLVGKLSDQDRIAIVQIMLGAAALDAGRIAQVLGDLAARPPDFSVLKHIIDSRLRQIRRGQIPGIRWLVGMLDEAVQSAQLRVSPDLLMFRKTLYTLQGVLLDLDQNEYQIDQVLFGEFIKNFVVEWPKRWVTLPNSREFATRLSNLDLTRWAWGLPESTARFWAGHIRDLLLVPQNATRPGS